VKLAQLLQILVGILCLVCPGLARALDSAPANGRIAYVVASGEAEDTAAIEVVVRELVAGLPVELRWSTASGIDIGQVLAQHAPDGQVAARAWLDLSNPRRARIYVANAQDKRFVVRVVPLNDGYDEVGREVIGHIVEFALDAFLSGAEVGVSRDLPATWDSPAVGARLAGVTARLVAGLETDIAPRWVVRGLLGLGADFMRVSPYPEPGTGSARAGQPLWTGSTVLAAMVDLEFDASARIGLVVGAGCDASLNRPSYFVAGDARQTTVLSPSVFHPTASFGMVFRIGHQSIALGR
jgi:hypothetical protein